jgi:hypothetical protein
MGMHATLRVVHGTEHGVQLFQLGWRDLRSQEAAVQADLQGREHPDAGFDQIFAPGEMDKHFGKKFGLIAGTA